MCLILLHFSVSLLYWFHQPSVQGEGSRILRLVVVHLQSVLRTPDLIEIRRFFSKMKQEKASRRAQKCLHRNCYLILRT
jgi:hypothetical protein